MIREEERNFKSDIVGKCKEEPRLFYRYINGKMKHREGISKLKREGRIYETTGEMHELMNESFQSVFTKETDFMALKVVSQNEGIQKIQIKKMLEELDVRKAMGPDHINGWILKECREQMEEPIWDIINSLLREGKVPREWKRANIVPIYKGGNKMDPLNYRPVSLTSIVSKLCEILIKDRWVEYLEDKKIITEKQFGFRKGRPCVTNLLSFYMRVIDGVQERN
uniref:Reverse transcriptase domain-containing protein n=1 Tax=Scylla olivacea TaxID=85551 RepID=A0A0P4VWZ9_SCYOL